MSSIMREDWIEVELQDVFETVTGNTPSKKEIDNYGEDIPFIKPPDISNGVIKSVSEYLSIKGKRSARILPKNSVLVTCIGNLGRVGYNKEEVAFNQQINAILPISHIDFKYTFYQAQSANFRHQLESLSTSTTVALVNKSSFNSVNIVIAPLPIQRAIVTKIEALFSDLDNGIANFKKAQEQLKVYRQAVLKKAFEGELTKEWREKQTNLPTAEELLKQIKEERQNHYNQQIEDWKKAVKEWEKNGKKDKKPSKPRKLKELAAFSEDELNEFVELPKTWVWSKVDKIIDHNTHSIKAGPFGSSLKKSFYVEKGYKIYGQEQVISGNHKYGDYYVNEKKYQELTSCAVKPNDALISLVGTVGKVLILPSDSEKGIINPRLIKISFNSFYSPTFFKYYFESAYLKSLYAHKSHGATMDIITLGIIQELPFPLFSISEQTQIVQEIESRLSVCDKMEQSINESIEKAEALRQSILKKAFEGRLLSEAEITQCKKEADYEPASELLKKIQAEKLAKEQARKQLNINKKSKQ
jgi:type I restriction enzyme S subunit